MRSLDKPTDGAPPRTTQPPARLRVWSALLASHPLLFAVFPLASFYAANKTHLRLTDKHLPVFLAFNVVAAVGAWLFFGLMSRRVRVASVMASTFVLLFLSLGLVWPVAEAINLRLGPYALTPTTVLIGSAIAILVVVAELLNRASDGAVASATKVLFVVGAALLATSIVDVVTYRAGATAAAAPQEGPATDPTVVPAAAADRPLPDVYYIVLDSYPSNETLERVFDYDNRPLTGFLEDRGFYVAYDSNSNYAHTFLSLPSTLNMRYLNYLSEELGVDSRDNTVPLLMIEDNAVVRRFKSLGYRFVNIGSGWFQTNSSAHQDAEVRPTDRALRIGGTNVSFTEFSITYLKRTALKPFVEPLIKQDLSGKVLEAFASIEAVPLNPEPTFTFAHLTVPHPPFLFDRHGRSIDSASLELSGEAYTDKVHFRDQVEFVSKRARQMVDEILSRSERPPLIVVASDHGSTIGLGHPRSWGPADEERTDAIQERMGILNAYYFPDGEYERLARDITPVNTFRVIFNQFFDAKFERLPDRSYYSNYRRFYEFYDVTARVRR